MIIINFSIFGLHSVQHQINFEIYFFNVRTVWTCEYLNIRTYPLTKKTARSLTLRSAGFLFYQLESKRNLRSSAFLFLVKKQTSTAINSIDTTKPLANTMVLVLVLRISLIPQRHPLDLVSEETGGGVTER